MNIADAGKLTAMMQAFVRENDDFRAMGVCGSWARGNARPDSDLDILIIARDPDRLRRRQEWIGELKFRDADFRYLSHKTARYGAVWSAHIQLEPAAEVELGLAGESWASTSPIDSGTRHIVNDAFKIVVDKDGRLERLIAACSA